MSARDPRQTTTTLLWALINPGPGGLSGGLCLRRFGVMTSETEKRKGDEAKNCTED